MAKSRESIEYGKKLMFDKESITKTTDPNAKLIRITFYKRGITNGFFWSNYRRMLGEMHPHFTHKQFAQKAMADRKFIMNPTRITPKMCRRVLGTLGFIIEQEDFNKGEGAVSSVKILDTRNGHRHTYSSDDDYNQL